MSGDKANSLKDRKLKAEIEQMEAEIRDINNRLELDVHRFNSELDADSWRLLMEWVRTFSIAVVGLATVTGVIINVIGGK